jgi:GNAT superfamily N-acetyltransferase
MPHIRFTMQVNCEDLEPSRVIPALHGEIFECEGDSDRADGDDRDVDGEIKIGHIDAFLVLRGRAINEGQSLFEAMDSINDAVLECYEALFDAHTDEWNESVEGIYKGAIMGLDVLFIESIELDAAYRGKGIGGQVVRETIASFGSNCGLVACKPFPLQYSNWEDEEHKSIRQDTGFEEKRLADFARFAKFWTDLGFYKLPNSDFYAYAPELTHQPDAAPGAASAVVTNRVLRGRRRRWVR